MSEHHVDGVDRVGAQGLVQVQGLGHPAALQHLVQHVPADQRHKLDGHLEGSVLASFARQRDVQIHLRTRGVGQVLAQALACRVASSMQTGQN